METTATFERSSVSERWKRLLLTLFVSLIGVLCACGLQTQSLYGFQQPQLGVMHQLKEQLEERTRILQADIKTQQQELHDIKEKLQLANLQVPTGYLNYKLTDHRLLISSIDIQYLSIYFLLCGKKCLCIQKIVYWKSDFIYYNSSGLILNGVFGSLSCRCFSSSRYRTSSPGLVHSSRVQAGRPNTAHTPNLNTVFHIHHTHCSENSPVVHLLRYTTQNTHITHSLTLTYTLTVVLFLCLGAAETGSVWTHAGRQCSNADTHQSHHTLLQQPNDVLLQPRTPSPTRHALPKTHTHRL